MNIAEGKARCKKARAGFIIQGTTLTLWCRENGTCIQNVRDAIFGKWQCPKATDLINRDLISSGGRPNDSASIHPWFGWGSEPSHFGEQMVHEA